jgi:hypothetical protein
MEIKVPHVLNLSTFCSDYLYCRKRVPGSHRYKRLGGNIPPPLGIQTLSDMLGKQILYINLLSSLMQKYFTTNNLYK